MIFASLLAPIVLAFSALAGTVTVTHDRAPILRAPNGEQLAYLVQNDEASVVDYSSGHFHVRFTNQQGVTTEGFVSALHLQDYDGESATVTMERASVAPDRNTPGLGRPYLVAGDQVEVLLRVDGQVLVAYQPTHTAGWIAESALTGDADEQVETTAKLAVTADRAVLRDVDSGDAFGYLIVGDQPTVLDYSDGQFLVRFKNSEDIISEGLIAASDAEKYLGDSMIVDADKVVLHPYTRVSDRTRPYLVSGDQVRVLLVSGEWSLVAFEPSHAVGWTSTSSLKKTPR